jgi:uncharacterized lipoprotein YajG
VNKRIAMGLIVAGHTAGCAITSMNVTPPTASVATGLSGGRQRAIQLVAPFEDQRPIRSRCGMKKNGYNMDTADVHCSAVPAQWLSEVLAAELTAAGFNVAATSAPGSLHLEGQLLQFFVEPDVGAVTFSPEADIHVRLVASSASGLLAERSFYVKGVETSLVATEVNFQAAVNEGVRLILHEMVAAIVSLADRYPGVFAGSGQQHASNDVEAR